MIRYSRPLFTPRSYEARFIMDCALFDYFWTVEKNARLLPF